VKSCQRSTIVSQPSGSLSMSLARRPVASRDHGGARAPKGVEHDIAAVGAIL